MNNWITERRNNGRRNTDKAPGALLYALSVADWLDWSKMPEYVEPCSNCGDTATGKPDRYCSKCKKGKG